MMSAARGEFQTRGYSFNDAIIKTVISDKTEITKAYTNDFLTEFNKATKTRITNSFEFIPKNGKAILII